MVKKIAEIEILLEIFADRFLRGSLLAFHRDRFAELSLLRFELTQFKRYEKQVPGHHVQVDAKFLFFID